MCAGVEGALAVGAARCDMGHWQLVLSIGHGSVQQGVLCLPDSSLAMAREGMLAWLRNDCSTWHCALADTWLLQLGW